MKLALLEDGIYEYATGNPMASGNGKWQWLLARALAQTGTSIVVGSREHIAPSQEQTIAGVRFVGMHRGNLIAAWSRFLTVEMPDWWYYQGAEALWGALVLVGKVKGVRGIFSTSSDGDVKPRTALWRRQRWWPLYAWGLNAVERIFVQHSGQFSSLSPKLQPKARVVPGLVSVRNKVKPRASRRNHIAWIAFLRQGKRPDLLIQMARKSPDLRFVVCGGTTTYLTPPGYSEGIVKELESLPNVDYLGHVGAEQCLDAMADASALLCTSELEGFPNTFLEAWSVGTPVVSLSIDPGDVIRSQGLGFVSGNPDQAICDMRRLLNSPETFDTVSSRARTYVEDVHSDVAVARVFNEAIQGER